jgi:hypothetical protein
MLGSMGGSLKPNEITSFERRLFRQKTVKISCSVVLRAFIPRES